MEAIVCLKAVPASQGRLKISDTGDRIDCETAMLAMNESDEYALEEAIALKKQLGWRVTVITAGRLPSQRVLHEGLAKGADKAVRIDANFGDGERISAVLAAAVRKIGADLVLTGVESVDNLAGEVGIRLAERLGFPYAYAVTSIEAQASGGSIRATKEIGGGLREVIEMPLPAVLCVQQGTRATSYVPVSNLLRAQSKPIECLTLDDLESRDLKSKLKIVEVFRTPDTRSAELIDGKPPEVAGKLLTIIRRS